MIKETFVIDQVGDYIRIRGGYPVVESLEKQRYGYFEGPNRSLFDAMRTCKATGCNVLIYTDYFAFEWGDVGVPYYEYLTPEYMVKDPLFYTYIRKSYYDALRKDYEIRKAHKDITGKNTYKRPMKFKKRKFQDFSPAFAYIKMREFSPRWDIPRSYVKRYLEMKPTATVDDIQKAWAKGIKLFK